MNEYVFLALSLFAYMNFWFVVSLVKKRNDVADLAWGLGFVFLAWLSFFVSKIQSEVSFLINICVSIWGFRLAFHISKRLASRSEDKRYYNWRRQWGKFFLVRSYFQVYILQGIFLFLIALPFVFINFNLTVFGWGTFAGFFVWTVGFLIETIADWQLSMFIKQTTNRDRIMDKGLWRFSRHPNYFGEVLLWWGIFLIALGYPFGYLTIIGPLTISFLILFVSGIPLLEKKYEGQKNYEEYKKRTSPFFLLPPKKI